MSVPVSVIIPCYRCSQTIARAVESVLDQTVLPAELIVVDDCSGDAGRTISVLRKLCDTNGGKIKCSVIELPVNQGPSAARNKGWDESKQPFVAFLDADDSWHPRKLEIQYQWMLNHPEVAITGHSTKRYIRAQAIQKLSDEYVESQITLLGMLYRNSLPMRSVMMRKAAVSERFAIGKRYAEDYLLWLNLLSQGCIIFKLNLPLAYSYKSDFGEAGLSRNLWLMELGELDAYTRLRKSRKIGLYVYLLAIAFSLIRYLRRIVVVLITNRNT